MMRAVVTSPVVAVALLSARPALPVSSNITLPASRLLAEIVALEERERLAGRQPLREQEGHFPNDTGD